MEFKTLFQKPKTQVFQLATVFLIFLIFFLNIFLNIPNIFYYLLILIIIANIVLGTINKKKNLFFNIILLILTPLLFIFLIGYIATIIGAGLSLIYLLVFVLKGIKEEDSE